MQEKEVNVGKIALWLVIILLAVFLVVKFSDVSGKAVQSTFSCTGTRPIGIGVISGPSIYTTPGYSPTTWTYTTGAIDSCVWKCAVGYIKSDNTCIQSIQSSRCNQNNIGGPCAIVLPGTITPTSGICSSYNQCITVSRPPYVQRGSRGDIDENGIIDCHDADMIIQDILGSKVLPGNQRIKADLYRDNKIDIYDAAAIASILEDNQVRCIMTRNFGLITL